jgi:hypothetical protein
VGRHGGRSGDHRDLDLGIENRITTVAGAPAPLRTGEEVMVGLPLGGTPWWDDAPVPPPVVVASADCRTPAMTFTPDADPFSAGGVFAPPAAREGEAAVVVHAAPDAAVSRCARRARSSGRVADAAGSHRDVVSLLRERDGGPDTGSLVRPYVGLTDPFPAGTGDVPGAGHQADLEPEIEPDLEPEIESDLEPSVRVDLTEPRLVGPTRRAGSRLDRLFEVVPPAPAAPGPTDEWKAPWTTESGSSDDASARSLFEPTTAPTTMRNAWAAPAESPFPSRKVLRARERASAGTAASGLESVVAPGRESRLTGRRLAKSGVLAVTAVGVVAASAPNAFSALGWRLPTQAPGTRTQAALAGLAGSGALPARDISLGSPAGSALLGAAASLAAPQGDNAAAARKDALAIARASAEAAARAGAVASGAGRTLVDVARDQVAAEAARKKQIAVQVSRNVIRDPRAFARLLLAERGWSSQYDCLNLLYQRESGWNYHATNPSSGAYGIPQALPGSKMASAGADWRTNPATQIRWGLNYIADRYGTPCGAWAHSQATGWY